MAPTGEDPLFPATSIGRTQGSRFQRVPSNETLTAHPLLSANSSSSLNDHGGSTRAPSPHYVPYTPRQRVSPTAATTGTTVHPSTPQQHGDATSKLQLVSLKAAAQNIGLDAGSAGWAILEKLVHESDHRDTEWTEVWTTVTSGKATLLLPLEQSSSHDKLTPEFVKDHIVLCDGPSRKNAPIVTLSGLRGILNDETLTFRSTIHPSSKVFQELLVPSNRASALTVLPDLPFIPSSQSSSVSYPRFLVPSHSSTLPLPPRVPPPLPPRPGNRSGTTPGTATTTTSRITNPFASLFGGGGHNLHHAKQPPAAAPSSPTASLRSLDSVRSQAEHVVDVSAFTIDRKIVRKDIAKEINKGLRREVRDTLASSEGMPSWVADRVHEFTADWYPFVKEQAASSRREKGVKEGGSAYVIPWSEEAPESTTARVQDFYLGLEQEVRVSEGSFLGRLRKEHEHEQEEGERLGEHENEKRVKEKIDSEAKIKHIMEVVERTICSLFYDRLYMQPTSDDSSHDEALSSRVAALNMLDLGLEHLDIKVENGGPGLDLVVRGCGETLSQLQACRSPGDKAAVIVSAHKLVVDGLSRLPPIRLMTEEESKVQKAKAASIVRAKAEAPPREPDGTLRILMPLTPTSTTNTPKVSEGSVSPITDVPLGFEKDVDLATPHAPASQHSPIPTIVEPGPEPGSESESQSLDAATSSSAPPASPVLTVSPPGEPTPVSGDVLLPMIIFAVVKANPPHLVSNLLFTQRYRNQSVGGEESYCLVNLMAVAEFLENVDLAALGLGNSDKVLSAADLTPIPLNRSPVIEATRLASVDGVQGSIRDRVEQANKMITGVVDSSFGMLRSLLPTTQSVPPLTPPVDGVQGSAPWNAAKPGFGLLQRENGFSIRSITSALPIGRGTPKPGSGEEDGQQLVAVPRPSSVKSTHGGKADEESGIEDESEAETGAEDEEGEDQGAEGANDDASAFGDARSIRSFESMMSSRGKKEKLGSRARKSLTDRLAHMSSLAGLKSQNASLVPPQSPASSRPQSPDLHIPSLAPPNQRFMECTAGDLRISEVGELLQDYRRLDICLQCCMDIGYLTIFEITDD
ncbi:putative VPS9 domain containing protein [Lyophyllum shimeji]|uniref:VPS9 domain containing protein n=1 Tax=Lyophyllum shimeji TaxID=47721 RepID=A0A9P3US53_LYOSH|nr:putative VPS9 domain containing protein [Lyophyllum shimeji]